MNDVLSVKFRMNFAIKTSIKRQLGSNNIRDSDTCSIKVKILYMDFYFQSSPKLLIGPSQRLYTHYRTLGLLSDAPQLPDSRRRSGTPFVELSPMTEPLAGASKQHRSRPSRRNSADLFRVGIRFIVPRKDT